MLLFSFSLALAECPSSPAELHASVATTVDAWRVWDWPRFDLAVTELATAVPCVDTVLGPAEARELHLVFALAAARRKDLEATTLALRALLTIEPQWLLPEDLGVPGSLLAAAWVDAHEAVPAHAVRLAGPGWVVDGVGTRQVPLERSALLQRRAEPLSTWYLAGGVLPPEVAARRPKRALALGLAGAAALVSTGAFATAGLAYQAYPETPLHPERLEAVNHAGIIGGTAMGLGAVGLVTLALVGDW